jgi:hypothetical protein
LTARSWSPVLIMASSGLAMVEAVSSGTSPLRTLVVIWFLTVCPGLAIVGLLRLRDPWLQVALVPALSLAVDAIVGGTLSYAGLWSPAAGVLILVVISVGGALAHDAFPGRPAQAEGP